MPVLDLREVSAGSPGLTPSCGTTLSESAGVCLDGEGQELRGALDVSGSGQITRLGERPPPPYVVVAEFGVAQAALPEWP